MTKHKRFFFNNKFLFLFVCVNYFVGKALYVNPKKLETLLVMVSMAVFLKYFFENAMHLKNHFNKYFYLDRDNLLKIALHSLVTLSYVGSPLFFMFDMEITRFEGITSFALISIAQIPLNIVVNSFTRDSILEKHAEEETQDFPMAS